MHRTTRNSIAASQGETRRSVLILTVSGLAIAGAGAALAMLRRPQRDAGTGCLPGPLARKTIVLVDQTDPWSANSASLLSAHLRPIAENAATEERLILLPFNGAAVSLPVPVFNRRKSPSTGPMSRCTWHCRWRSRRRDIWRGWLAQPLNK